MERHSREIVKVSAPKKIDRLIIRTLITMGLIVMAVFVIWFANPENVGSPVIYWILTFALFFKLIKMLHEWYHYWSVSVPVMPVSTRKWTVDVLTTSCPGEPREMVIKTLKAMVAIRYPHTNYLCDEGDDPYLKEICDELGVVHVTRLEKIDAKAGNINHALEQASGEICVVLDPDHVPIPEFLDRVLPYFEDPSIGFVQCVQGYGNQNESFIARGAAEQTYHFYGPMMMCMNTYGTVQAIGANCTFRREALDSIGGHASGLSEDMHTAMQLHAKGWKSLYIPEILTRGLVPATLSSYYKQQLKWSRGTFELLFRTFPKLYRNFTWRQKIHYFTIPLYFLYGLINLIDILIPVLALVFAIVPWEVNVGKFAMLFVPLCSLSLIIRLFAQRWLLEKHETGFHFAGGILRTATWWIFLIGFVYTIFNIKVPYIPTPKEDEHRDYWKLSLPNIITIIICSITVFYGLSIDWSPYSLAMAFYVVLNVSILGFVIMMSQQKTLHVLGEKLNSVKPIKKLADTSLSVIDWSSNSFYRLVRNGPMAMGIAVSMIFLGYTTSTDSIERDEVLQKDIGGFYLGVQRDANTKIITANNISVISSEHKNFPYDCKRLGSVLNESGGKNIPLIQLRVNKSLVVSNETDSLLKNYAEVFIRYQKPVFISLLPANDSVFTSGESFVSTWQRMVTYLNASGVSNLTWVWCPESAEAQSYYPGTKFVDWIGVACIGDEHHSFSSLYNSFRTSYGKFQKPVMIYRFECNKGEHQSVWFASALQAISTEFREIKSVVFSQSKSAASSLTGKSLAVISEKLQDEFFSLDPLKGKSIFVSGEPTKAKNSIAGREGKFSLISDGKPYYIKGVAYNTQHDWRDGNMPLTRRQLEKDFERIRGMGANTVRRYDHGIYDRNILNVAREYDLKVLYGFWFDPKIDYYKDSAKVQDYIEDVISNVEKYKDHESVLGWAIGNETWGLLKHNFSKPYLTIVRQQYIKMVEVLARKIHEIDPNRPVFTCIEHEEYQIAGELVAFRDCAPSVDVLGINSYYQEQISKLNHITYQFDPKRPYVISEFGPRGYWDPKYNRSVKGRVIEEADEEKAQWYKDQWNYYVDGYRGYNVGGFAYCWHDRMEGTYTWFGLTDYKGRLKKSYYALKNAWTKSQTEKLPDLRLTVPDKVMTNGEYVCSVSTTNANCDLKYYWRLLKDEYLEEVRNIETINEHSVKIKVPMDNAAYRLYVYASDNKGNVVTASSPIITQ